MSFGSEDTQYVPHETTELWEGKDKGRKQCGDFNSEQACVEVDGKRGQLKRQ